MPSAASVDRLVDESARRVDRLVDAVGRAASWLTLAVVVLMAVDVLLRYGLTHRWLLKALIPLGFALFALQAAAQAAAAWLRLRRASDAAGA